MRNRKIIRRLHAEQYLLLTLISFAISVSLTRLLLYLTGYPQLGNSELHIAHVLWGGLILFVAVLLPILFANRLIRIWSAIISGIGVGLFIDEVGKFITQSNDYFYPSAAPIIYGVFLLTLLIYVTFRRKKHLDAREELYVITQLLEEVLDHDLTNSDRLEMLERLQHVKNDCKDPQLLSLADNLTEYLTNKNLEIVSDDDDFFLRIQSRWEKFETRWFPRSRTKAILIGGMVGMAAWMIYMPATMLLASRSSEKITVLLTQLINQRLLSNSNGIYWFKARLMLEAAMGLVLFVASFLFLIKQDQRAIGLAYIALMITITVVNILVFYYDQFSTIFSAIIQFLLMMGILRYHKRFLGDNLDVSRPR
jgi:hypothetical protein